MAKHIDKQELATTIRNLQGVSDEQKSALLELLNEKKQYGLVWENHAEDVEELLREQLPVLTEVPERRIISNSKNAPNHIIIEGDNLHALASLCYTHEGKIDVIEIDPPYNTGKKDEFKYNDSFVDGEDSYRHSKWLSFISKRLKLAYRLLANDGLLFIHIDDNEIAQLKCICDELFGCNGNPKDSNCLGVLIWDLGTGTQAGHFTRSHEYVLTYCKNKNLLSNFSGGSGEIDHSALKKISKKNPAIEYTFKAGTIFTAPDGTELTGEWGENERTSLVSGRMVAENGKLKYDVTLRAGFAMISQMKSFFKGEWTIDSKGQHVTGFYFNSTGVLHYTKERSIINPSSVLSNFGSTKTGTTELTNILGSSDKFGYPKSLQLIHFLLSLKGKDVSILDFFAGSGTTLHATMLLNSEDEGNRQCILVTNNENNICEEVTYERNKRVINGYTTPKGVEVDGLYNNNLRYYRTEFVPREKSNTNKRRLVFAATDILCIKENIYDEDALSVHGKNVKKQFARRFSNDSHEMLVVYEPRLIPYIVEEIKTREITEPIKVYVFSEGQYAYNDDFKEVLDKVNLCALPEAIYQAYKKVLPKTKSPEEIAFEASEEEVEEAMSVADTYSYKSE